MFSWVNSQDISGKMDRDSGSSISGTGRYKETRSETATINSRSSKLANNANVVTISGPTTSPIGEQVSSSRSNSGGRQSESISDLNPDIVSNPEPQSLRRNPMYLPGQSSNGHLKSHSSCNHNSQSPSSSSQHHLHPSVLTSNMIKSGLYPVNGGQKKRMVTLLGLACRLMFSFLMVAVPVMVIFYFIYHEPISNMMNNYYQSESLSESRSSSNILSSSDDRLYQVDASSTAVYVKTKSGKIQGERVSILSKSLDVFLGVPYAEAPIGDLRFRKPRDIKPWNGIYRAARFSRPCLQFKFDHRSKETSSWISPIASSEDCLYLNIWSTGHQSDKDQKIKSPSSSFSSSSSSWNHKSNLKPVLIFIHGGSFVSGSADVDNYDGAVLSAFGDIIVVTLNYRLGIFGFLNVNHETSPGNQGLHDQAMAIKWVKNNIEAFGGNPDEITICGQGSGAYSVGFHLISPITRNLFKRAILQSGSPLYPQILEDATMAIDRGQQLALRVSCANDRINIYRNSEDVVNCLRKLEGNFLAKSADEMILGFNIPFSPTIGNEFLPINPYEAIKLYPEIGNMKKEILIGSNKDEGSFFLHLTYPKIFTSHNPKKVSLNQITPLLEETFKFIPPPGPKLISHFFNDGLNDTIHTDIIRHKFYETIGDFIITCPAVFFTEQMAAMNYTMYHYQFTHRPSSSKWGKWMGSTHYDELPFIFGIPFLKSNDFNDDEREFSARLMDSWVAFVKHGTPLAQMGAVWPQYTLNDRRYMTLDPYYNNVEIGPHEHQCNVWRFMFQQVNPRTN